jgi:hypothetical protein
MYPFLSAGEDRRRKHRMERAWCAAVLAFVVIGLILPSGFAEAGSVTTLINTLLLVMSKVLEWIILFVGRLVIIMVDVIIQVAQYNHFTDATPVREGWPLVRDITNMFFIVLLLVTAFGTIVQYQKLHYRQILPKLLLMAVLVNFSKTLIGLLIDFSQVLMLTFVNGFKAAAGGNFVDMLKLNKLLALKVDEAQFQAALDSDVPKDPQLFTIVIAEMLAVFFLGITIVMLLILLVYLIVRIVGLWIALILSPFALFMTAVPPFLASKVSGVTDNYWSKLGALLSGGPLMAFFLWLTLATVQGEGFGGFTSTKALQEAEASAAFAETGFASAVGNVEDIATFFVAIIMLLMGVNAAVSIGSSISEKLGAISGRIRDIGVKGAKFAAYGGFAAAGAAAATGAGTAAYRAGRWGARTAGGAAARGIDQRLGVTRGAGRLMRRVGLATGIGGLATAGARVEGTRRRAVEAQRKRAEEQFVGLSKEERIRAARGLMSSVSGDKRQAGLEMFVKDGSTSEGFKKVVESYEEEGKKKNLEGAALEAYKKSRANEEMKKYMAEYEQAAKAANDEDKIKWHKEQMEKNPHLDENPGEFVTEKMFDNPKYYQKVGAEAYADPEVLRSIILGTGDLKGDVVEAKSGLEKALKGNDFRSKALREFMKKVDAAKGQGVTLEQALKDDKLLKEAKVMGGRFVRGKTAKDPLRFVDAGTLAAATAAAGTEAEAAPRRVRRAAEITSGRRLLDRNRDEVRRYRERGNLRPDQQNADTRAMHVNMGAVQYEMMGAGATLEEASGADEQGTFANRDDARGFGEAVNVMHREGDRDVRVYNYMDVDALNRNPDQVNEARSVFVRQTNVDQLHKAYERAQAAKDKNTLGAVAGMARAVDAEGSRVERSIQAYNRGVSAHNKRAYKDMAAGKAYQLRDEVDMGAVRTAAEQYRSAGDNEQAKAAARQKLSDALGTYGEQTYGGAGAADFETMMDDAQAVFKKQRIETDMTLRNFRRHATSRTGESLRRVGAVEKGAEKMEEKLTRRAERRERRGAETPGVEPSRPGEAMPARRPDVLRNPPPGPQAAPDVPPPPGAPGYNERDVGEGGGPDIELDE